MKGLLVFCLSFQVIYAVTHSWKAFYTGSTGLNTFPEFVALNLLDDEVMGYFDSRIDVFESKKSWMMENLGQEYVEQQTNTLRGWVPTFKANIQTVMERFNESKGVHIFQTMYGCDWDDETAKGTAYYQFGYDGEDFISFDLKTGTWIAPTSQAVISKNKWDQDKAYIARVKNYFTQECPDWVKKYVNYGKSSLLRTVLPSVSLLQKTPSSPVSCHATGFYPDRVDMFWKKDGQQINEDVDHGEILPNHDGSFQMSVHLDISSVKPEDWSRYDCAFQLSGVKDDIITKLDKAVIKSNESSMGMMIIIIIAVVVLLVLTGVIGFIIYRKKNAKPLPSPASSAEVMQHLNPPN